MTALLHATVDDLATGDVVCLVSDATGVAVVAHALPAVLSVAGIPYGVATQAAVAGGPAQIATSGLLRPTTTGLTAGASRVRVSSAGRLEKVGSFATGDYPAGYCDAAGYLNFVAQQVAGAVPGVASLTAGPGLTVTGSGALTVAADPPPLQLDLTAVANATGRNADYESSLQTYASTIDASLTTLTAYVKYDKGCAAAAGTAKLPVMLILHGYSQDASESYITQVMKERWADHGFVAVAPHQRGRGGNPGTADDCRDLQDIVDAIAAAAAAYPTVVDTTRLFVDGYSGGGAAACALLSKYVGKFIGVVSFFSWGDVGLDPRADHSAWGAFVGRALIAARVGGRDNLERYRARSVLGNIGQSLSQSNSKLWLLWDAQDPIGRCLRDVRDALVQSGAPTTKWRADETDTGDTVRWLHGYPTTVPDLALAEALLQRLQAEPAPTTVHSGTYDVAGYLVHGAGFEVWCAPVGATNAKTDPAGGQRHSVRVEFNADSQQYRVTPKSGTCVVTIIQGRRRLTKTVSTETVFDLANSLEAIIPDAKHLIDMARGVVLSGSNITSVACQITGSTLVPPGAAIVYDDTDTEYPAAKFTGSGDNLRGDALSLLTGHEDFEIVVRARATLGQATQTLVAYADGTANQFITIFVDDTTIYGAIEGTSQSAQASFNLYPHSTGTPGVASFYNIIFLARSGSTLTLRVNAETVTGTASIPNPTNACAATRLSLGSLDRTPGNSEIRPNVGAVSHVLSVVGRTFTAQERTDLYDHLFQIGEFRSIA